MMLVIGNATEAVKLTKRQERALGCVHMLEGCACGNWPEARQPDRICPILKGGKDEDFCPFKGSYGFRTKGGDK